MAKQDNTDKSSKSKRFFDKIKDSGKEFVEGVKEEIQAGAAETKEKTRTITIKKSEDLKTSVKRRVADTSTPEEVYYSTWAWFWAMIFSIFICLTFFMFSLTQPRFIFVGFLVLLASPFIVVWCLIHMIPTIKIFGFTVFDRRKLSLRRQLTLGKEIARLFSREFFQESPIFAFLLFSFLILFVLSLLFAVFPT